uniref:Ubiquinol-cytochrome-c reductase complex assembly factor 3 n=2 Tax=Denticeps clupeoides TaxID=299321 RepID=A0AAY4CLF3_9TELE
MGAAGRIVLAYAGFAAVVGVGWALWVIVRPGEERTREILKELPEANPLRLDETRRRNALMMQVLKDAAETKENIARGTGPLK